MGMFSRRAKGAATPKECWLKRYLILALSSRLDVIDSGRCPRCASKDVVEGPSGGMFTHMACNNCHNGYLG